MNAAMSPAQLDAMRVSELQHEALLAKTSVGAVVVERARRMCGTSSAGLPSNVWQRMHESTRMLLLMVVTDRQKPEKDAKLPWSAFEPGEQAAIGALARQLRKDLERAEWLR